MSRIWTSTSLGGLLAMVVWAGCPHRPVDPAPRPPVRRQRPLPAAEVTLRVTAVIPVPPAVQRIRQLPPFPRFADPYRLPRRSLRRERRMAYRRSGRKRQVLITHIAARLWRLANTKIARIRRLVATAKREGRPPPRERVDRLQRKVSAHLRECVTLLEGVLENPAPPVMARVRLAHYLRKLKPAAAARLFERLLRDNTRPADRRAYGLDLAQLWLGLGRDGLARRALRTAASGARGLRPALLRGLALRQAGGPRLTPLVRQLIGAVSRAAAVSPPLLRSVLHHLPVLLARTPKPQTLLRAWKRADGAGFRRHGPGVVVAVLHQLLLRGDLSAARSVSGLARTLRAPLPAALRSRLARLVGPWSATAAPPPAVAWSTQLRARAPALTHCFVAARVRPRPWRMELWVAPDGSVRRIGAASQPGAPPRGKGRLRPVPTDVSRCLRATAKRWRFPPWRQDRAVRLTVAWRVGP